MLEIIALLIILYLIGLCFKSARQDHESQKHF